jgi:DNA-binding NarL/FixJ family response regulator
MTTTSPRPSVHGDGYDPPRATGRQRNAPAQSRRTILVVGRDKLFADAIGAVLGQRGRYEIVSADSSREALRLAVKLRPPLALISLELADIAAVDGVPLVARMRVEAPGTLILGMVRAHERAVAARATEHGLQGVVSADDTVSRFIRRIDEALRQGSTDIPPPRERRSARPGVNATVMGQLTTRESEVLELLVQSLKGREIAERLGISRNTVRSHMNSILHKLQVHSRLEAAAFAVKHEIVEPPSVNRKASLDRSARRKRSA